MTDFAVAVAEFALADHGANIPQEDRRAVGRSVLDTVGAMLAGTVSEPGQGLLSYSRSCERNGKATVLGTGLRRSPTSAALLNGSFAHSDDFDDMGGYGHPSAPMLGAMLPAIEMLARDGVLVSGSALMTAHAIGFELGAAFCGMGSYDQYERCFHSTPVFGALAATCAVGRLRGLDTDTLAMALRHAAVAVSGLGRNSGTMVKPVHAGLASRNALLSIEAALAGVDAPIGLFEARGGFVHALFGHRALDLDAIVESLGAPWRFARTVSIKRFPCCGSNHSALNAVEAILRERSVAAEEVDEIVVRSMMDSSPVLRFPEVRTGCSAKFSVQYVIAALLVKGALAVEDFRDDEVNDPRIAALARRVKPEVVNRWDQQGASKQRGNPVSIRLRDGSLLEGAVPRTAILGGPRHPLPDALLHRKYMDNAALAIGQERAAASLEDWSQLEGCADVATLVGALG